MYGRLQWINAAHGVSATRRGTRIPCTMLSALKEVTEVPTLRGAVCSPERQREEPESGRPKRRGNDERGSHPSEPIAAKRSLVMHGQEVRQRGLHNAQENGSRWLKLTVQMVPGFGEEGTREKEGTRKLRERTRKVKREKW